MTGSRASTEPSSTVSALTGFDPARVADLAIAAKALRDWMNSVVEQRNDWTAMRGVEVDARDALQVGFRIAGTVVNSLEVIAEQLTAIAMEARKGGDGETRLHPKDDSAGPQDIAQGPSQ